MANCAVVQVNGGLVVNTIVAEVTDLAPDGCFLVEMTLDCYGGPGWFYDGAQFLPPSDLGDPNGGN